MTVTPWLLAAPGVTTLAAAGRTASRSSWCIGVVVASIYDEANLTGQVSATSQLDFKNALTSGTFACRNAR